MRAHTLTYSDSTQLSNHYMLISFMQIIVEISNWQLLLLFFVQSMILIAWLQLNADATN